MSKNTATKKVLAAASAATGTFLALDGVWIAGVAKNIYESAIPHLMADSVNPLPAAGFYASYLAGTVYLAAKPLTKGHGLPKRLRDGAILGALAYGTWGFTASSVLKDFPVSVALSDAAWGAVLTAATAAVAGKAADAVSN